MRFFLAQGTTSLRKKKLGPLGRLFAFFGVFSAMTRAFYVSILGLFTLLLTSCGEGPVLLVEDGVVHLSPVNGNPSVGYFTVRGGPKDVRLLDVSSDSAIKLEMHETVEKDGMSTMQTIDASTVPNVPAGGTLKFEPGGKHLMIWGITLPARRLGQIPLVFFFDNGDRIIIDAKIVPMGGAAAVEADEKEDSKEAEAEPKAE